MSSTKLTSRSDSNSRDEGKPEALKDATKPRRELAGWWKQLKRNERKPQAPPGTYQFTYLGKIEAATNLGKVTVIGVFGIPLHVSIQYANTAVANLNAAGQRHIMGYIPIVVAKTGSFLKEEGNYKPREKLRKGYLLTPTKLLG